MLKSLTVLAFCLTSQLQADPSIQHSQERIYTSDQELANTIKQKIGSGWITKGYDQIDILVQNGIVTLQGSVQTEKDRETVEKRVRNIDGVKGLDSRITVLEIPNPSTQPFSQDSYTTQADYQLNRKIRDRVSHGVLWDSYKDISLNTNKGVVTLHGTVESEAAQQKLIHEILNIEGVQTVISHLILK